MPPAWVGHAESWWAIPTGILLAGAGAWSCWKSGVWPLAVVIAPLAFLCLAFTSIRVEIDEQGLQVFYGPWGWHWTRIPLEQIERVSAIDVRPLSWGGWGYRGMLRIFKQAAVVLRGGEGLRLDLSGGRVFVVTVDDAASGAAVLNQKLAAR